MKKNLVVVIVAIALLLRFHGLEWDADTHLHPDERFLTMVTAAAKIPQTIGQYLDPEVSTLNPENNNFPFFVYGLFPVSFTKIVAVLLKHDNYHDITVVGRGLSAFFDLLIVLLILKTVYLFEKHYRWDHRIKYLAALLYGIAVLPIQLSHFFTVDTFLSLFVFAALYQAICYSFDKKPYRIGVSALLFGMALSSKITAVYMIPLIGLFIIKAHITIPHIRVIRDREKLRELFEQIVIVMALGILYGMIALITLRILSPYMFASSQIYNFKISGLFMKNMKTLEQFSHPDTWFPPSIQWLSKKPVIFSLQNLASYGVGVPYFLLFILGTVAVFLRKTKPYNSFTLKAFAVFIILFFLYQSSRFIQPMRYFLMIYPFIAICAAIGIIQIINRLPKLAVPLIVATAIWPLAFSSIYNKPHTRIAASTWIYDNISPKSALLGEHWDDLLPLRLPNKKKDSYNTQLVFPFERDTEKKWKEADEKLAKGEYLILSSNRAWASIMAAPERYPQQSEFYKKLFAGKTSYKKIKEFTSYPSLSYLGLPIQFRDDRAEESFTVYDHPVVMIFQNTKNVAK